MIGFTNYKLPYISYTPTFSICKTHKYIKGEYFECPQCGEPTTVYSRVTGYIRPVQGYHVGKRQEYNDRIKFDIEDDNDENN
jgi:ribonucleoside-triphosphate reductase